MASWKEPETYFFGQLDAEIALDLDIYRVPTTKGLTTRGYMGLQSNPAKSSEKFQTSNNPWFHCAWLIVFPERYSHMFGS